MEEGKRSAEKQGEGAAGAGTEKARTGEQPGPEEQSLPPADFSTFILSLSTSALMHLGEIENPETKKKEVNRTLARHTIDILAMLEEKTKGNLTEAESALIENILYDLRMKFCAKAG